MVKIPREVYEGLEAVRQSGLTSMLDMVTVAALAERFGYEEAANWVRSHKRQYAKGVFCGFEPEEGHGDENR